MDLTIIIPFRDGHPYLDGLLAGIPDDLHVIIVNDDSAPAEVSRPNTEILHLNNRRFFAGAVNVGIEQSRTDVLVINQDVTFDGRAWLDLIVKNRGRYAMIGEAVTDHPAWPKGYVQGTFMFLRRDALDRVGLLNEVDYPLWGGTCEWQLRAARKGYSILPVKKVPGFNHLRKRVGSSIKKALRDESELAPWLIRTPPMVSVVIPCHNHGRYLRDAVNSLVGGETSLGRFQGQTFQSFEVIVVDDNSPDETAKVMAELADDWKAVRYVKRKVTGGTPAANNTGIAASYGQYVTILCADDMMESDRLEYMVRELERNPHGMVYDNFTTFAGGKRVKSWAMQDYDFETLLHKNHVHAGIMFTRQAWEEVGGYPEEMSKGREDWAMNVRLGIHGYCGSWVADRFGYLYRREKQNRTLVNTTPTWRAHFLSQLQSLFPKIYAGERPMGCCGSGSKNPTRRVASQPARQIALTGENGMALVQYLGKNFGLESCYGPVSGARYSYSRKKNIFNVDNRDLRTGSTRKPGLLEMKDNGRRVFKLYSPPPAPKPVAVQKAKARETTFTRTVIPKEQPQRSVMVEGTPSTVEAATLEEPKKSRPSRRKKAEPDEPDADLDS